MTQTSVSKRMRYTNIRTVCMSMTRHEKGLSVTERVTQATRRERTRSALLTAARELFAERGFADTGRDDIAARAGVTSGALYHHFESKTAVAAAVVEALDAELVDRGVAAA